MFYCGIDIARRNHEASVIDAEGNPLLDRITITNTQEGCETLFSFFKRLKIGKSDVIIGMEASGHYWLPVYEHLTEQNYDVRVISPIQSDAFRKMYLCQTKSDSKDSFIVAQAMRFEQYLKTTLSDETMVALRQITRFRMALVDSCGDCKRRIITLLDQVFPEYASLFFDAFGVTSKELLLQCPTPEDMLAVSTRKLVSLLKKARELCDAAAGSFGVDSAKNALAFQVCQLIEQLMFLERIFTILKENRPYEATPPKKSVHSEHVRKATLADLPEVVSLFKKAIHRMSDNGIYQWDDIYPDEKILKRDIAGDTLYLYTLDGQPASVFVLNQICDSEYSDGSWKYPLSSYAVVHRLCVNPAFQHMGIGTRTMLQVEILAKSMGIESIRLDAFSLNPAALRLYDKLGYAKTGAVTFRKGLFYLFEKKL
ncbi:MAG: GNAT family N-acetyltransferase [Intestinimonas sp.]|nr:GNAT family N-acetyltransferase [Intestinimonas sp.]